MNGTREHISCCICRNDKACIGLRMKGSIFHNDNVIAIATRLTYFISRHINYFTLELFNFELSFLLCHLEVNKNLNYLKKIKVREELKFTKLHRISNKQEIWKRTISPVVIEHSTGVKNKHFSWLISFSWVSVVKLWNNYENSLYRACYCLLSNLSSSGTLIFLFCCCHKYWAGSETIRLYCLLSNWAVTFVVWCRIRQVIRTS